MTNDILWYEDESESSLEQTDISIKEYEITSSPNDFNILTLYNFLESGVVKIPDFQRNYVWDAKRASKLIESLIIGLPIPQIFLYEEARNKFLIIDGQQRLMTIYYFIKQRFPRKEKRVELGRIFDEHGSIPESVLNDAQYFRPFKLQLDDSTPLNSLMYSELGELKSSFDLCTIRNIIIKQTQPDDNNTSVFEIFNRLNTGSLNLRPQEIRSSLYHSEFDKMLKRVNLNEHWRNLIGQKEPDLRLKDVEMLLRSVSILFYLPNYKPPMASFLNSSAGNFAKFDHDEIMFIEELFIAFFDKIKELNRDIFLVSQSKFTISVFESIFYAACNDALIERDTSLIKVCSQEIYTDLKNNIEFQKATSEATGNKENVLARIKIAESNFNE